MSPEEREKILERVSLGELTNSEAARLLGSSRQNVNQILKRRRKKGEGMATPFGTPPVKQAETVKADTLHPATPAVPKPTSLKELLEGTGHAPEPPRPAAPPPPAAPVAPPPPVDHEAAELGKSLLLRIRGGIVRGLLRYWSGVDPNDPAILALLPKDMQKSAKTSLLEEVLTENPDKTQHAGKILRGWPGILFGTIAEVAAVVGIVRDAAERQGVPDPAAPKPEPAPPAPAPVKPVPKDAPMVAFPGAAVTRSSEPSVNGGFDIGRALAAMNRKVSS